MIAFSERSPQKALHAVPHIRRRWHINSKPLLLGAYSINTAARSFFFPFTGLHSQSNFLSTQELTAPQIPSESPPSTRTSSRHHQWLPSLRSPRWVTFHPLLLCCHLDLRLIVFPHFSSFSVIAFRSLGTRSPSPFRTTQYDLLRSHGESRPNQYNQSRNQ